MGHFMRQVLWRKKKYKEINLDEQRTKGHKKKVLYVPRFFFLMYKRQFLGHLVTHIIELVNFLRCLYLLLEKNVLFLTRYMKKYLVVYNNLSIQTIKDIYEYTQTYLHTYIYIHICKHT